TRTCEGRLGVTESRRWLGSGARTVQADGSESNERKCPKCEALTNGAHSSTYTSKARAAETAAMSARLSAGTGGASVGPCAFDPGGRPLRFDFGLPERGAHRVSPLGRCRQRHAFLAFDCLQRARIDGERGDSLARQRGDRRARDERGEDRTHARQI